MNFSIIPVQAASFELRFSGSLSEAKGVLQFEQSNLTGRGKESATLSELDPFKRVLFDYNYQKFDFIFDGSNDITNINWTGEPIFYFDSGNLVGLDLDSNPSNYTIGGCRSFPCQTFRGTVRYEVRDNISQEYWTGSFFDIPDPFTEIETPVNNAIFNRGMVEFTTIEPIPSVPNEPVMTPEPGTFFGLVTIVFLGWSRFKK